MPNIRDRIGSLTALNCWAVLMTICAGSSGIVTGTFPGRTGITSIPSLLCKIFIGFSSFQEEDLVYIVIALCSILFVCTKYLAYDNENVNPSKLTKRS